MSKKIIIALLLLPNIIFAQYSYFGTFNNLGVPNYLAPSDNIPTEFLNNINSSLPENYPVPTYNPQYIAAGTATEIKLVQNADVWVTFVNEGAGYKNVLGFYTYPIGSPPASVSAITNLKIIFPNVSKLNSGGGLLAGHKVHLGTFTAGTAISWFLIADGFRNGGVTNGNWRLFSNPSFNPEANPALQNHTVLLYDSTYQKVVMGFEDIRRDYSSCDNDFNDAIFYVSSNPITAISTNQMVSTVNTTPNISSGNTGGLESNHKLGEKIAQRFFAISKNGKNQANTTVIAKTRSELSKYIPNLLEKGLSSNISTPYDLVSVTNAKDVISIDYVDSNNAREAVVFLTKTENEVYNHTKAICDRLNGAKIEDISHTEINGYSFLIFRILQESGEREYATCFSVSDRLDSLEIQSHWLQKDYNPSSEFYNYQIWSKYPHTLRYTVEQILGKLTELIPISAIFSPPVTPQVYFLSGKRHENELSLTLLNKSESQKAKITLSYSKTETGSRYTYIKDIDIIPHQLNDVTLPLVGIFDAEIQLEIDGTEIDALYLADGAWGFDVNSQQANINFFHIGENQIIDTLSELPIYRTAAFKLSANEPITLFRTLRSGNKSVDLSEYSFLNIEYETTHPLTVKLAKPDITSWTEQPQYKLFTLGEESLSIPLNAFTSNYMKASGIGDVRNISFTQESSANKEAREVKIKKVSFSKKPLYKVAKLQNLEFQVYPNPATENEKLHIMFNSDIQDIAEIILNNLNGSTIQRFQSTIQRGQNHLEMELSQVKPGNYVIQVLTSNKSNSRMITVK